MSQPRWTTTVAVAVTFTLAFLALRTIYVLVV